MMPTVHYGCIQKAASLTLLRLARVEPSRAQLQLDAAQDNVKCRSGLYVAGLFYIWTEYGIEAFDWHCTVLLDFEQGRAQCHRQGSPYSSNTDCAAEHAGLKLCEGTNEAPLLDNVQGAM